MDRRRVVEGRRGFDGIKQTAFASTSSPVVEGLTGCTQKASVVVPVLVGISSLKFPKIL